MPMPPKRVSQHEIDSEACKTVFTLFSRAWEIRDLTGRDFGIDKIAERFESEYATGELLLLQIKGTKSFIDATNPRFSLETKTLMYAEMFSSPFLLLYCSITEPKKCYYLWLQEYIRVRLNFDNPKWKSQETNTVYFPKDNILGSKESEPHLHYISKFPQYKDSWVEYYTALENLCFQIPRFYSKETEPIFNDKIELDKVILEIVNKLEAAATVVHRIPKRFIPDCFIATIELGKHILDYPSIPEFETIHKLIMNCIVIETSVVGISQRFNSKYLRKLYEIEGCADF